MAVGETQLLNITDIATWFQWNDKITEFPELAMTGTISLKSASFQRCISLRSIDLSKLMSVAGSSFENCSNLTLFMPNVESVPRSGWTLNSTNIHLFLPNVKDTNTMCFRHTGLTDIGTSIESFMNEVFRDSKCDAIIIRAKSVPLISNSTSLSSSGITNIKKIFVPENMVSAYTTSDAYSVISSKIAPIGGTDWQSIMKRFAANEGYELQPGESWTDEYIDYKIYGVEPPTE